MRYLLVVLLLACASVGAQNVNELPLFGETQKSHETIAADQRFVDSAVKAAGSREAAARMSTFRGWQHLKQGDAEVAIQSFNQAYLLQPNNVEVYWGLGVAMTQQGKYDMSVRLFGRALALDPDNARLLADVGLAHTRAAVGSTQDPIEQAKRLQGALPWFDAAQKLDPDYPLIYANRAITLYFLGNLSEAWANIEKAETLDQASVDPKLIADMSKKFPRPATASAAPAPDTAMVKTESVPAQSEVLAAERPTPQPVVMKEVMPKIPQGIPDVPAPQPVTPAAAEPPVAVTTKQESSTQAPREAQMEAVPAPTPLTEPRPISTTAVEAAPARKLVAEPARDPQKEATYAPKKKLSVISGQPVHPTGPDKRACLNLPTNEAIMRCVYPRK